MVKKLVIIFVIMLTISCSKSNDFKSLKTRYENECNIIFSDLIESRTTFLKIYLSDIVSENPVKEFIDYEFEINDYLMMENELLDEANNLNNEYELIKNNSFVLTSFKLNKPSLNILKKQSEKLLEIKNKKNNFSLVYEFILDSFLEVFFVLICVIVFSLFSEFSLKLELFKFFFGHWVIITIVVILSLIIKPAERLGLITSSIDKEIEKIINLESNDLKLNLDKIKNDNIRKL